MLRTKHDTAMLKAALTSCSLSGPLAARDICVTLHIPTVSRDKVPPAPHEAVANVVMLTKRVIFLNFYTPKRFYEGDILQARITVVHKQLG